MLTNLVKLLRIAVVLAFGLVAPTIAEAQTDSSTSATTTTRSETAKREPKGDANAGLLWIGGAVLALIFLAWLALRIGDVTSTSDKVPN